MKILRALPARIKRHNAVVTAAGIAFYGLLALVPTLLATVSIYGLVNEGNEDEIKQQIEDAAGSLDENTQGFIEGILEEIVTSDGNTFALLFGLGLALFSASGAVQKLMGSIAVAYDAIETRPGLKLRLLAYLFTMAAIIGVVLMALVLGVIPALLAAVDLGGPAEAAIRIGQLPLFTLLFVGGLTVLYRYAPDRQPRTPWLNPGAWVAAALWLVFAILFSVYSANIGAMPASYGLLGTVAALMIFLQLTSIAIIIGAEINAEREDLIADHQAEHPPSAEAAAKPLSLAQAAAGLAVLFVLGRGSGGGN
ncbi:MAG: YihY/virulence factor BrkB family protein [Actinomycetia bacterium]|nr:YihY/virulence factor BrkB family protein [Actinomycetes bacterium]